MLYYYYSINLLSYLFIHCTYKQLSLWRMLKKQASRCPANIFNLRKKGVQCNFQTIMLGITGKPIMVFLLWWAKQFP